MIFDIVTLFPDSINFDYSILGKAQDSNLIEINTYDLRNHGLGKRRTVDDTPYGGGPGMVMMIEPIHNCLAEINAYPAPANTEVIFTAATGHQWDQSTAEQLATDKSRVVIVCGHYEGIDRRAIDEFATSVFSIGPYILTGGELAAQIIVDSTSRLIPGVLGNQESLTEESNSTDLNKEYPHYTKPRNYKIGEKELSVPNILLSGNHAEIDAWRQEQSQN